MDSLSGVASVGGGGYRKNMGSATDAKSHVATNLKAYLIFFIICNVIGIRFF